MVDVAPNAPMGPQEFADVLANQERVRKSTDLPLFYAMKEKDACTAELFMERFEVAANIARWIGPAAAADRYVRTCREFYLLLRGNALQWWASLDNCLDFDKTHWPTVRERFLESYARKYTPTSACTGLTEMRQRTGEGVQDYFVRCNVIYDRLKEIRPQELNNWRGAVPALHNQEHLNLGKQQGTKEMGLFFLHLLFVSGLRDEIRTKTIEVNDNNLEAARVTAKRMELIVGDKKRAHQVAHIRKSDNEEEEDQEDEPDDDLLDDLTEDEFLQLNAIRKQRGRAPFKRNGNGGPKKNFRDFKDILCHYCNKKGHYQKVCRKRQKDGKPMVFKTNSTQDEQDEESEEPQESVNSMSIGDYYGINSLRQSLN